MGSGSIIENLSDGLHYPDWVMQMEALLEEKELWDIVQGTEHVPNTGPNSKLVSLIFRRGKL